MNPLEEFLLEKNGAFKDFGAHVNQAVDLAVQEAPYTFSNALVGGAALGVAGGALSGAYMGAQAIYNAATKGRDFRKMLEVHPDLKDHPDQKMVNQAFSSLRSMAPDLSKDPLVAGSYVRNIVDSPLGAAGMMQEAMRGQGMLNSPVRDATHNAIGRGMVPSTFGQEQRSFGMQQHGRMEMEKFKQELNRPDVERAHGLAARKNELEAGKLELEKNKAQQSAAQFKSQQQMQRRLALMNMSERRKDSYTRSQRDEHMGPLGAGGLEAQLHQMRTDPKGMMVDRTKGSPTEGQVIFKPEHAEAMLAVEEALHNRHP